MRRLRSALAVLAAAPLVLLPAGAGHAAPPSPATYLSLGDSVAAGVGASQPGLGYVPLVAEALQGARHCGQGAALGCRIAQVDLSVVGATTTSLIAGQLPAATALLQERNGNATPVDDVRLITLTIGGNDLFRPVIAACSDPTAQAVCSTTVATQLRQVATNLAVVLQQLRAAAGPSTTIAVTTYYNGLAAPGCPAGALAPLAQVVLEGGALGVTAGLNQIIRSTAAAYDAVVVELAPVVQPAEVRPDCLHPTDAGHADIAAAVVDQVLPVVVGPPGRRGR